jgi:hypothetical protein
MNPTPNPRLDDAGAESTTPKKRRSIWTGLALATGATVLAACGGAATSSTTTTPPAASAPANAPAGSTPATPAPSGGNVLPVTSNPINNTATDVLLAIDEVLVENNVDPATGKAADDHLEIAVTNTGTTELTGFEVYYTITDPTTGDTESYYTKLPDTFTIAAGASRTIHFDNSGAPDHFPDNPYSLYHTSLNGLDVTVEVSAQGAAPQTATVQKDPGGDEVAD